MKVGTKILLLTVVMTVAGTAQAQTRGVSCFYFDGAVGGHPIGANLAIRDDDHRTITAASYFYANKRIDIPLVAGPTGDAIILREPGGGEFTLRFQSASVRPPLNFYNTNDLAGTWRSGARTLPATLRMASSGSCPGAPKYADLGVRDDRAFEANVARFIHGATTGDAAEAARAVHFPLRVNRGTAAFSVRNPAALKAQWGRIFTPGYVAKLRRAVPHNLFVHNGTAMIADGAVWFDAAGATVLNPSG